MGKPSKPNRPPSGSSKGVGGPSEPEQLGQIPERAVPVELAVRGARAVLRKRFGYDIWFRGELVELVTTSGGHGFCVLRGADARINVYLAPAFVRRRERPAEGSLVLVRGRLNIWGRGGRLEITASGPLVATDLAGVRAEAKRAAERKLRGEGVLDRPRRSLPRWPARVALVTSGSGAAIRDVHATIRRRAAWIRISLHDCVVQGPGAAASIIAALDAADGSAADLVLLTRGGGAPDDLDPFDDPAVVRRVAKSRLPIIVAVGHEGDRTLADLAADRVASTPSAAAELAVPDGQVLRREVQEHWRRLYTAARATCSAARGRADGALNATRREAAQRLRLGREELRRVHPRALTATLQRLVRSGRQRLEAHRCSMVRVAAALVRDQRRRAFALRPEILVTHGEAAIRADRHRVEELHRATQALSPNRVLARGYALVVDARGETVRSAGALRAGDTLRVRLHDGEVAAVVATSPVQRPSHGGEP